jgi:hypothetical protein
MPVKGTTGSVPAVGVVREVGAARFSEIVDAGVGMSAPQNESIILS